MTMHSSPGLPARPPSLTAVSWRLVILVALVLAVIWAVPLFFLFLVWFTVVPVWAIFVLVTTGICFAVSRSQPSALSVGIGVLGSMPLTIVIIYLFLAVSSSLD
ncbi:MAG: hypothetical protein ACRDTT_15610 [Pseudonocardiaceae bacterium]